jgi:rfaE bifunctional protein nucleotidyltransferase chain/domain
MKHLEVLQSKIMEPERALKQIAAWRINVDRIVFTNGCFDLLHPGHVKYLAEARDLGHRLVVGLNSDSSVKRLKGADRPVQDENARAFVLAGLSTVDAVIIFDEDTPLNLIKAIQPDVLVKGGDWPEDQIVGADIVKAGGGQVLSLPFSEGYSTSALIEKIRK